jgi:hypothetical protein
MFRSLFLGAAACALSAQAPAPPLTYDALLARAKPDPALLRIEADLAARERQLTATGGLLREGPTVLAEAGRRVGPVTTTTDKVAQVDAPLLLAPGTRGEARRTLDTTQRTALALGKAEARARLHQAYLDAWLAQAQLRLRTDQLATMEDWLRVARARVESGSDPAYQEDLVRGDLARQRTELGDAHRRAAETWAALRALAELPPDPQPLADPGPAALPDAAPLPAAFEGGLARRSLADRLAAEQAAFQLQQAVRNARWSLKGSYASEGEERITRLGVAYRFPRAGELGAQRREEATGRLALQREGEAASLQLASRFQTALARLRTFGEPPDSPGFAAALQAVDLRLREGKERPSEALLLRRQLLEAEAATLQRLRDAHALIAELDLLTLGDAR